MLSPVLQGRELMAFIVNILSKPIAGQVVVALNYYQLAFLTPGISPAEAISRNWIRDRPN